MAIFIEDEVVGDVPDAAGDGHIGEDETEFVDVLLHLAAVGLVAALTALICGAALDTAEDLGLMLIIIGICGLWLFLYGKANDLDDWERQRELRERRKKYNRLYKNRRKGEKR